MRIVFDGPISLHPDHQTGPSTFAKRLAKELTKMGHEVLTQNVPCDSTLIFIEPTREPYAQSKKILRLDGFWMSPEEFYSGKNNTIMNAYHIVEEVIFQSEFDKKMAEKHFGPKTSSTVIHNGIEIKRTPLHNFERDPNNLRFVCSSNWHTQKRLKENVGLFQHIRRQLKKDKKDAKLFVLGSGSENETKGLEQKYKENVVLLGQCPYDFCFAQYAMADYMIHLEFLGHCPNVVIEALSQKCPVICTNSGGTHEIVKNNGITIEEKIPYNFDLIEYDKPYKLDFSEFFLPEKRVQVRDIEYLNIEDVAKKYLEVLKE